uniref:Uncharacterized protein n=1 Tax=Anopheles culicifacies TaxID=139723 RepID=A0A182M4A9_9DIPT
MKENGRDSSSIRPSGAAAITTDHPRGAGFDPVFSMLTDMSPSAGAQFYSTQIPAMGMNITNITTHMQKPSPVRGQPDRAIGWSDKAATQTRKPTAVSFHTRRRYARDSFSGKHINSISCHPTMTLSQRHDLRGL